MDKVDSKELWRLVPPEEKFTLMARAQANGVMFCLICFITASTLAIALQFAWIMWGSLLIMPFVFQLGAGKAWRALRPKVMLEYLAARSAARRYAYTANSKDLQLQLMFRGRAEYQFSEESEGVIQALDAAIENAKQSEVWIALFNDALVLMSERPGGAEAIFAHLINEKLEISGGSPSDSGEYSNDREISLAYSDKRGPNIHLKLTSQCPAALVVLEKKLFALRRQILEQKALEPEQPEMLPDVDERDRFEQDEY